MSDEIGTVEAELLRALRDLGVQQRATTEEIRALRTDLASLRAQTNAATNVLAQRVLAVEDLARDSAGRLGQAEQRAAEALGRAAGAERAAGALMSWPLRVLAAAAVVLAAAAVVAVALIGMGA